MNGVVRTYRIWTMIVGVGLVLLGLLVAETASADETDAATENFHFSSWDVTYQIGLDTEGHAHAEVTESLVAQFPQTDQNRGIVRSLPLRYQGAPAAPEDISVTDGSGNPVPFEIDNADGFRSILIGDDSFVHGSQEYNLSYTVDDVMHATEAADEFYWDVVPVDRQQPIDEVSATITFDPELTSAMTGSSACYLGTPNDTAACDIEPLAGDESTVFIAESGLPAGQGITAAIGVDPGTVTQPSERQDNFTLDVLPLILVVAAVVLSLVGAVAAFLMVRRYRNDTSHTGTGHGIPEGINPLLAKWLHPRGRDQVVAMMLDLAVRGVLRIETDPADTKPKPVLRLLEPQLATDPLETVLLRGLFPGLAVGDTFDFPKNSKQFTQAAQQVEKDAAQAVTDRGLQTKVRHRPATLLGWFSVAPVMATIVLLIVGASRDNELMLVSSIILIIVWLVFFISCMVKHRVLTPRGAAVYRQLEQLRQMMEASEAERLDMLQSFTNATRQHTDDSTQMLQLYDRLLPYAVFFGMQQDWSKVLAAAYEQHPQGFYPVWYPMLFQHGSDSMSTALSSMLDSVSSAAATSSPSAGSTGGGVAGGGGGGGAAGGR